MMPSDITNPQQKEIFETLIGTGHIDEANGVLALSLQDEFEKSIHRAEFLLSFLIAKRLEKETCSKAPFPCGACRAEGKVVGQFVWGLIQSWILTDIEPNSMIGELDIIQTFNNVLNNIKIRMLVPQPSSIVESVPNLTIKRPSKEK